MEFIIFGLGVIILFIVLRLRGRVRRLERLVAGNVAKQAGVENYQSAVVSAEDVAKISSVVSGDQAVASGSVPVGHDSNVAERFANWLKEDWLLKLGAFLLLIGFGWLTSYAFLNNWIGPMGRIVVGIIAGALFIMLGYWRIKNYLTQGGVFLVLGSTTILLTVFAARTVYGFFTPLSALVVMFLSTVFVALASVKYNSHALSLLSLILAGVAPLLTKSPDTDHVGLFAYLLVVILGAIWVVVLTGQRSLTLASLIIVFAYSVPHLLMPGSFPLADNQILLLFAYAFATIFFLTNMVGFIKLSDKKVTSDLITAAGNGLFLLSWIMAVVAEQWRSLIIVAWLLVFTIGAFFVFRLTQRREGFYVNAGVGIVMLAAATSAELAGATLTIAYTIECGIITLITYLLLRKAEVVKRISLLFIGPVILSFPSIVSFYWQRGEMIFNAHFFVLLVLGLTLLGLGTFFWGRFRQSGDQALGRLGSTLLIIGSVYAYVLLWLSLKAGLANDYTAVIISLVVYTMIGLIAYIYGLSIGRRGLTIYGGTLVGFVVGRLLLVDVWKMALSYRIITFFLIGALLISTAFLGKKKQPQAIIDNN